MKKSWTRPLIAFAAASLITLSQPFAAMAAWEQIAESGRCYGLTIPLKILK